MAFGAVLLSFPVACFGTIWVKLMHQFSASELLLTYSILGSLTFATVIFAAMLGRRGQH